MAEEYIECFGTLNGEQLEFWFPKTEDGLEKDLTQTEKEIESLQEEIENLKERKAEKEADTLEDEQITVLEKNKAEAGLKLNLINQELSKLKERGK